MSWLLGSFIFNTAMPCSSYSIPIQGELKETPYHPLHPTCGATPYSIHYQPRSTYQANQRSEPLEISGSAYLI